MEGWWGKRCRLFVFPRTWDHTDPQDRPKNSVVKQLPGSSKSRGFEQLALASRQDSAASEMLWICAHCVAQKVRSAQLAATRFFV
jgi:hypothetical protein